MKAGTAGILAVSAFFAGHAMALAPQVSMVPEPRPGVLQITGNGVAGTTLIAPRPESRPDTSPGALPEEARMAYAAALMARPPTPSPHMPASEPEAVQTRAGLAPGRAAPGDPTGPELVTRALAAMATDDLPRPAHRPDADAPEQLVLASLAARAIAPAAPTPALRPAPRPEDLAPVSLAVASTRAVLPDASRLAVLRSPLPQRRSETERLRHLRQVAAVRTQPAPGPIAGRDSGALCGVAGIQGTTMPPISSNVNACGIANPVRVTAVDGVRLSQAAVLHCDTARALHHWVRNGLRPAVGATGGGPAELRVAGHYVCRTQNHRRNAPVSEHGRGRAIDISAIRLASGEVLNILRDWRNAQAGSVLRAAYQASCGTFTTTLGPGSDGMHEDHFHFDVAQRRTNRPICR